MSAQSEVGSSSESLPPEVDPDPLSVGAAGTTGTTTNQEALETAPLDPNDAVTDQASDSPETSTPSPAVEDEPAGAVPAKTGRTRLSASWTAVVAAAIVLIALVIFIGQNTQQSTVNFLGAHGKAPTAVVLLIAALAGAVIVIAVGIARILQLRKTARQARRDARHATD
jgi:uncharacterized integral membrane protein